MSKEKTCGEKMQKLDDAQLDKVSGGVEDHFNFDPIPEGFPRVDQDAKIDIEWHNNWEVIPTIGGGN